MDQDHRALAPGTIVDEYRIECVLGTGGFGITYLAIDLTLGLRLAIKEYFPRDIALRDSSFTVRPGGSADDRALFARELAALESEGRILAVLDHPAIVRVRRLVRANGTAYLVMDYVAGRPFDAVLAEESALAPPRLLPIADRLLDGLAAVHAANLVHRDIKPGNLILRPDDSPVLIDFGAARRHSNHSRSVTAMATAGYAPFEQYSTRAQLGPWSDLYGLSATLYRAIAGRKPPSAVERVLDDPYQPLAAIAPPAWRAYPALLAAIDAGLAVRPEARPQSVAQWRAMADLRAPALGVDAEPTAHVPPASAQASGRSGADETTRAAAAANPAPAVTSPPRQRAWLAALRRHWTLATGAVALGIAGIGGGVFYLQRDQTDGLWCRPAGAPWAEDDNGEFRDIPNDTYANNIFFGLGPKDLFGPHRRYAAVVTDRPGQFALPDLGHTFRHDQRYALSAADRAKGQYNEQFDNTSFAGKRYYNAVWHQGWQEIINFGVEDDTPACVNLPVTDESNPCRKQYFQMTLPALGGDDKIDVFDDLNAQDYTCKRHS